MTDPQDEAIGKLSRAVVVLSVAVLILLGLILLTSFTTKRETQQTEEVSNKVVVKVENYSHNPAKIPNAEMHGISIDVKRGFDLFKNNCSTCHKVEGRVCNEDLKRVFERIPNERWFMNFIADSDSLINSGDPYAVKLDKEWKSEVVHEFSLLTEEEVINIGAYIIANS